MEYHVTAGGKRIALPRLTDEHLLNIVRYIERAAREGHLVQSGSCGSSAADMHYDEFYIYGEDVEDLMGLDKYLCEVQKRGLNVGVNNGYCEEN